MDELRRAALITLCAQAIARFWAALDAADYDTVARGMAPEGVWHRQGRALRGPEGVRAALAERPAGRVTAHLVQNLVVDLPDENTANARYFSLVFRHDAAAAPDGPVPLGAPLSIAAVSDRLRRGAEGEWLVVERRSRPVFAAGAG
ncbi:nuclear transport factor 2 family protein [Caldovatus aquaticus]|uniref:Nuclear transport factor 2 family protein n=1 Tax=Caldovatus aquaticus TaxID=2865671 RepID=A0ABS7F488_9PROT|nr:nuclear transport factor 2 family protein [Caldovatus aquaticus]MBW8270103.1 nuclear transport factor 2 family protein [Caldovatus aquaticus]